ncbi:ABC transporter substrate-binding protein [Devosia yakushimensis]|uniref:ABC transporter substrate-binding protein n=1 Tax=Devosia yakushimensis TaxID=470028 RepID=A0ABQ5UET0_9HYPH|nr:iron-siderophore ABC transporter substrate-binding protein [Devosia yakushimensis]GLQ10592.1 ABC transporter substrate-binding protein [Devosia yakushimensis]
MFGTVAVPDDPQRVVALGWSDAEIALQLGVKPIAVIDWQDFGTPGVGAWAVGLFEGKEPLLLDRAAPSIEQIAALAPDLILNVRSAGDADQYSLLSQIAPTVFAETLTAAFNISWQDQVRQVARALNKSSEGEALVAELEGEIAGVRKAHPEFSGKRLVVGTKFGDGYGAYVPGDARMDLLAAFGFAPLPALSDLPASGFYVALSSERTDLLEADILVMFPIHTSLDQLQSDPLIAGLDVVRSGRAILLDPSDTLTQAFSAGSPLAIRFVLKNLVPMLARVAAQ